MRYTCIARDAMPGYLIIPVLGLPLASRGLLNTGLKSNGALLKQNSRHIIVPSNTGAPLDSCFERPGS